MLNKINKKKKCFIILFIAQIKNSEPYSVIHAQIEKDTVDFIDGKDQC